MTTGLTWVLFLVYVLSAYLNCMYLVINNRQVSDTKFKIVVIIPIINTLYTIWLYTIKE